MSLEELTDLLRAVAEVVLSAKAIWELRERRRLARAGRGVEDQVRVEWRKSSLSTTNGCFEAAVVGDRIAVRNAKDQGRGPVLEFTAVEWSAFLGGVRRGEFDLQP
jgi:Domain of unknown function (DUF397)